MAEYEYRCPRGHETLIVATMAEEKPPTTRCRCGLKASRVPPHFQLTPDVGEHWNPSIGAPVRSRRHLTDLQKRSQETDRPFQDYQTVVTHSQMRERADIARERRARAGEKRKSFKRLPRPADQEWGQA